jgi:capsid protein
MEVDVQQTEYWWTVWAHAVDGSMWLLAWGQCVSTLELKTIAEPRMVLRLRRRLAARDPLSSSTRASWIPATKRNARTASTASCTSAAAAGWPPKAASCRPAKKSPIFETTIAFNYDGKEVDIPFIHYNDDQMSEHLARFVIKERQHARLPVNLDEPSSSRSPAPYLAALKIADGRTALRVALRHRSALVRRWKEAEIFHFIFMEAPRSWRRNAFKSRSMKLPNLTNWFRPRNKAIDGSGALISSGGAIDGSALYDGANDSKARSSFVAFPLTARREFTRYNRVNILKKVRALEANLGLITRMKTQVGKYAVGRGVFPIPQTRHLDWNEESATKFDDWANNRFVCDAAGAMTFWERQRFHAETFFAEAESFDALISSSVTGAPQLQLFDNSEIGSPYYTTEYTQEFIDGVKPNAQNRALSYLVSTQTGPGLYGPVSTAEIAANDMIHLVRRKRANQLRGISPFAPGINCAIDKLDIRALTTAAAKLHEALGVVVKKKSGEAAKTGISGKLKKDLDGDGKLTQVDEKFIRGAAIQYLGTDEEIEIISSQRPSQNLMDFLHYLIRDICLGTGLSFEIVWNLAELGGATARIALADAQWFFDSVQDAINEMFNQRVWVWWCASMMKSGQLSQCQDPRWWNCHWQGPPKLTADAGRTMSGQVDAMHAGLDNWESYYARAEGRYWQGPIKQRIAELKFVKEECERAGIDPALIFAPKPGTVTQVSVDNSGGSKQ